LIRREAQRQDEDGKDREPDDHALIYQARSGSQEAFRCLFERYHERIYRTVYSMVGSSDDSHDIVQQTFIRAFSSLGGFKQQSSFYTWLYRITLNVTTDYRRKQSRKLEREFAGDSTGSHEILERIPAPSDQAPDEQASRKELASAVRAAIDTLSKEHREILTLREINGFSYAEITEITGLEAGTVMSRLHYGRKKLAEILRQWKILE
jgi:RNA polymerase sigma-70 factor, ECF subfamily